MIKLDTLTRWRPLAQGEVMTIPGEASRRIRLHVNSPGRAVLYLRENERTHRFLAAPVGREVVEFTAEGDVEIVTGSDDVQVYTAEFEPTFVVVEDPEIFTQIAQRAARNPELEHMMWLQQQNVERRMAQLQRDMEARYERDRQAERARSENPLSKRPKPDGDGSSPVKGDGANEPASGGGGGGDESGVGDEGDAGPDVSAEPEVH